MLNILFVCHGNICRSTMAESVFSNIVSKMHKQEEISVSSAATHTEEIGNPPHYGTVRKLREVGIPLVPHRARLLTRADGPCYDFFIGMDEENRRYMRRILGEEYAEKIFLLLDFTDSPRAISDPWYTGNFDETYDDICLGLDGFWKYLVERGLIA